MLQNREQALSLPSPTVINFLAVTNSLSIVCGIIVAAIVFYSKYRHMQNDVPLAFRVSLYIGLIDAIGSATRLFLNRVPSDYVMSPTSSKACLYIITFSTIASVALSNAVALSLHLNVLSKNLFKKRANWYYEYVAIALSLVLSTPVFFLYDFITFSTLLREFFMVAINNQSTILTMALSYYSILFIGILYCYAVFAHVCIFSFFPQFQKTNSLTQGSLNQSFVHATPHQKRKSINTIRWMLLYPLVPIISDTFFVITGFFPTLPGINNLANILSTSQGILNFIVFTLNPKFRDLYFYKVIPVSRQEASSSISTQINLLPNHKF
ncbi:hypothetical protein BB561_004540 [Smittium simulii]|uniref:G-protein coupled receptors family 1 profile domain-containing protein n=1 Tax=Smittium simulii TaxID=133385 RepID=A0A2T9YFW5_9FUNG|nr:hypothetical protein BB561_004540 [Smittium simulii]